MPLGIQLHVSSPPRGGGAQDPATFEVETVSLQWSWGVAPAPAVVTYVAPNIRSQIAAGAYTRLGILNRTFHGVCLKDTLDEASGGKTRRLEFADLRWFLNSDVVYGVFNAIDTRVEGGRRVKRYRHLLPANFSGQLWTYTAAPLTAAEILDFLFNAPTVWTSWARVYHADQLTEPVYDLNLENGSTLAAAIQQVSDRHGLVFTLDSISAAPYRLVWVRKGDGVLPLPVDGDGFLVFPSDSDDWRTGVALSGNPTRIRVTGDPNRYQVLNVAMQPDWNRNWERLTADGETYHLWNMREVGAFCFDHGVTRGTAAGVGPGVAFNAIPGDSAYILGNLLSGAWSRQLTVRQFHEFFQTVHPGAASLLDNRQRGGRSRNDMPVALYLSDILFRAYRPPDAINLPGRTVAASALRLVPEQIVAVNVSETATNPAAVMTANFSLPLDGGGVAAVKGFRVDSHLFNEFSSDRFNAAHWKGATQVWQVAQYEVDQSGADGGFILLEQQVVDGDDLTVEVDKLLAPNARPTFDLPPVRASLTFEAERFLWTHTTLAGSLGHIDAVANANGLRREIVVHPSGWADLPYDDGGTATGKAIALANTLLARQYTYLDGGYTLRLTPASTLPDLGPTIDRLMVRIGPSGHDCTVDFTNERRSNAFEPERDTDRRVAQQTSFPGQQELRQQARDMREQAALVRGSRRIYNSWAALLFPDEGQYDPPVLVEGGTGTLRPVGTPLWGRPVESSGTGTVNEDTAAARPEDTTTAHTVFKGVTTVHNEPDNRPLQVRTSGRASCRVLGPVQAGDRVGFAPASAHLVVGGEPAVGVAKMVVTAAEVKLIHIQLGEGGGADPVWL